MSMIERSQQVIARFSAGPGRPQRAAGQRQLAVQPQGQQHLHRGQAEHHRGQQRLQRDRGQPGLSEQAEGVIGSMQPPGGVQRAGDRGPGQAYGCQPPSYRPPVGGAGGAHAITPKELTPPQRRR